ncbi:hypothetical protein [Sinomonas sp.]|uniref:hypothetical protein n=1 Tax=Sinomonas sp. TaxID=1914986 RepID=UPI003F81C2FE
MGEQPKMHDPSEFGFGTAKRLTDPELAAELHKAIGEVYRAKVHDKTSSVLLDRMQTILRFATHPHYDEEAP